MMKKMTIEAEITENKMLHFDLPVDLPPGKVNVVVEIQPLANGIHKNGAQQPVKKSQQELWAEFERLTRLAFAGVTWKEIKEGRQDDENRY